MSDSALRLAMVSVGPRFDLGMARALEAFVTRALDARVRWLAPMPRPEGAWDERRGQLESTRVMHALLPLVPPDCARLLAITEDDLFIPALTFLFGRAQLDGPLALVSLARLRPEGAGGAPDLALLERRACTETMHELGHTLGLPHCESPTCAMAFSATVDAIDGKRSSLCRACSPRARARRRHLVEAIVPDQRRRATWSG